MKKEIWLIERQKRGSRVSPFSICEQVLLSDILLWTLSHGRAKVRRPARPYAQQLCANTGCSLEDLPGAMDDREGWRERVRAIHAGGTT